MANFTAAEVNAWLESTELSLSELDPALAEQVAVQIKAQLGVLFPINEWVDENSTPDLIRSIMAMQYVANYYDRVYSDNTDETTSNYSDGMRRMIYQNIRGLQEGTIVLEELPDSYRGVGQPSFFPNDASSLQQPTDVTPSDGPPAFTMGQVF